MNKKTIEVSTNYHGTEIKLMTGKWAPQADMAVVAQQGETMVLATVVSSESKENPGFLPLTVNYEEKLYAGGIIKTSRWVKREGRPSDINVAKSRLIDHAIRPLFPKNFRDEVQVVVTVLAADGENDPLVIGLLAVSAMLTASPLPFKGPFASLLLGYQNNEFVVNPKISLTDDLDMHLFLTYLEDKKLQAVEGTLHEIPDDKVKEAFSYGYEAVTPLFELIKEFTKKAGKEKREYIPFEVPKSLFEEVKTKYTKDIKNIFSKELDKISLGKEISDLEERVLKEYEEDVSEERVTKEDLLDAVNKSVATIIREMAIKEGKRVDGRKLDEIRNLFAEVGIVPRVHGSAFFERGLTQVLSITTLGSPANTQVTETLYGEKEERFFHHYVALGFSTGEPRRMGSVGRREIGHGMLAQNALLPVLPNSEDFPYVIRVVSEVLSQNGSSSMASVCGTSLSLLDAGVPIKDIVGGVSIGLMTDENKKEFKVLTDIQGIEDFSGFMDYKMAGTKKGVTAIQMDIKLAGVPLKVMEEAIDRSTKARLKILEFMESVMSSPREDIRSSVPKIEKVEIDKDQIGLIIGAGGKTIKSIEEETGASVDIVEKEDKGIVYLTSADKEAVKKAKEMVEKLVEKPEVGKVYEGVVTKILSFGALVEFLPGKEGLVHVSEISDEYVSEVTDFLKEGEKVRVKLKGIEGPNKYVLTLKF